MTAPVDRSNAAPKSVRHTAALDYAGKGIAVFPCRVDAKQPACVHGHLDATTDPEKINAWWDEADYNIGWTPARSGHVFVDLDCKPGQASGRETLAGIEAERGEQLPSTPTVTTPSGGEHHIYRGTMPSSQGKIGAGIDIRGGELVGGKVEHGGYGLLPPSVVDGKPYTWKSTEPPAELPEWFAALDKAAKTTGTASKLREARVPISAEKLREMLICIGDPDLSRTDWRDVIAAIRATNLADTALESMDAELLNTALDWSAGRLTLDPPGNYDGDEEVEKAFWSLDPDKPGGIGPGTIYKMARDRGYAGAAPRYDLDAEFAALPSDEDELFSTGEHMLIQSPPPIEELIPGLIEKHCVAYASGAGGLSKSRVALQWGVCVHTGTPVYDRQVERAHFVHVSYENGKDEDVRRVQTVARRVGIAHEALRDYIPCNWKGREPLLRITEGAELVPTPLWAALDKKLRSIPGHKFIVFDSLYNVFAFEGNAKINETAVQRAIDWLDNKMVVLDASGLMLMHPSTAGIARGDNSGWSVAWSNRPRVRLAFKAVDHRDDLVELAVVKRNNGPKGKPITLHWHDGIMTPDYDAAEERAKYRAVIEMALRSANGGQMLKRKKGAKESGVDHVIVDEIEKQCGVRVERNEIHRLLECAVRDTYLSYQEYDNNKRGEEKKAGYRPGKRSLDKFDNPWEC